MKYNLPCGCYGQRLSVVVLSIFCQGSVVVLRLRGSPFFVIVGQVSGKMDNSHISRKTLTIILKLLCSQITEQSTGVQLRVLKQQQCNVSTVQWSLVAVLCSID